ncbi:MAG TPA: hypothetical protein VLW50_16545 [Streptosporangiaceae bacterium]|nr:hypothetical protein [Streptosporangiaceae bacterium]
MAERQVVFPPGRSGGEAFGRLPLLVCPEGGYGALGEPEGAFRRGCAARQLLLAGGVVLAVPWWASHRRRARVRVERKLEAWPQIAQSVGQRHFRRGHSLAGVTRAADAC